MVFSLCGLEMNLWLFHEIVDYLTNKDVDIPGLTETWFHVGASD